MYYQFLYLVVAEVEPLQVGEVGQRGRQLLEQVLAELERRERGEHAEVGRQRRERHVVEPQDGERLELAEGGRQPGDGVGAEVGHAQGAQLPDALGNVRDIYNG